MKKAILLLALVSIYSSGLAQKKSSGQSQTDANINSIGLMNGCNDAKKSNAIARRNQILNSSAQSQAYKEAYDGGWNKCYQKPGQYEWYKGKLIFKGPKSKPKNGPKLPNLPALDRLTPNHPGYGPSRGNN